MSLSHVQDHSSNVYIAVTVSPNSALYQNPSQLAVHPSLTHIGQVGELRDVQLLYTPRQGWSDTQGQIMGALQGMDGVRRVDLQDPPRTRAKRDTADL
jgi:hypothetical protein